MRDGTVSTGVPATVRPPRRLWLWFAAGFFPVFIGMLLLVTMTAMHPFGQHAVRAPLWHYYRVTVPQLFGGPSTLSPASGGTSALIETVVFHVLCSGVGGRFGDSRWMVCRKISTTAGIGPGVIRVRVIGPTAGPARGYNIPEKSAPSPPR